MDPGCATQIIFPRAYKPFCFKISKFFDADLRSRWKKIVSGIRDGKNFGSGDPGWKKFGSGIRDGKNSDLGIRDKHPRSATLVTTNTFVSGAGIGDIGASELPGQAAGGAVGGLDFGSDGPTSSRSAKN
jgi:hypothetical protein